jgi:transposase-like protein
MTKRRRFSGELKAKAAKLSTNRGHLTVPVREGHF